MDILCCYKRADKKRRTELLCTFGGKSFAQIPRIFCPRDATVGILGIEHDTCIYIGCSIIEGWAKSGKSESNFEKRFFP